MGQPRYYGNFAGQADGEAYPYSCDPTFGSDIGPGLQSAFNNEKDIRLGPGTFKLGTQVFVPQGRRLIGTPGQTIIKQANGANLPGMISSGNLVGGVLNPVDWENIYIEDIVMDGNGPNQTLGGGASQCALAFYGSDIHMRRIRVQNCGTAAVGANTIPTGILLGASLENPPSLARLTADDIDFLNCTGVSGWLTNAKGGVTTEPNSYGSPGASSFTRIRLDNCIHGVYVEDRCNGWTVDDVIYTGNPGTYTTYNPFAVGLAYSTNGHIKVKAKWAGSALTISAGSPGPGGSWQETFGIFFDVIAENCSFAGVRLLGTPPFSGALSANILAGAVSLPVTMTTNPASIAANSWILIGDSAGGSEWVQASGPVAGGNIPLSVSPTNNHNMATVLLYTTTGLHHVRGKMSTKSCGSVGDNAGLYAQQLWDSRIEIANFDAEVYGAPLNQFGPPVQYYGAKLNTSRNVTIVGKGLGNRDTAFYDDGTNTNCAFEGDAQEIFDAATRQLVTTMRYAPQATTPSVFLGMGLPNASAGKNGDVYFRNDGNAGADGPGTADYRKTPTLAGTGSNWYPGRTKNTARSVFNGDGVTLTFKAAHGLSTTPNHATITPFAMPTSLWVYGWDATYVWIQFTTAPAVGVANVAFDWEAWI